MKSINRPKQIIINLKNYQNKSNTLMILGSGWNDVIQQMQVEKEFEFGEVFGADSGVPGHHGKLVLGKLKGKLVWIMAGRFHTYEGYSTEEVTRPIQAFAKLGVERVVVTSAAGQLNESYRVGDIVILSDVLCLFCYSPLQGPAFQDMSQSFDLNWRKKAMEVCAKESINHQESGVYVYMKGPHFESYADKRALQVLGADCVGMSTIPETIMANHLGLKVLGLSCITNLAFDEHSHEEVMANAQQQSKAMVQLLQGLL